MSSLQDRLFVIWHDRQGGFFFPIAQLVRRPQSPRYEFRYLAGFQEAYEHGLEPMLAFPDVAKVYRGDHLFPFFENRLMRKSRPDYAAYVHRLGLDPSTADEMAILGRSGGERATDAFLLMPEPTPVGPKRYEIYFWVSDTSRVHGDAWQHLLTLDPGTTLQLIQRSMLVHQEYPVGRIPDYVKALLLRSDTSAGEAAHQPQIEIVLRNPPDARHMLLCKLLFTWEDATLRFEELPPISEDPERAATRREMPRLFYGQRLPGHLDSLVIHLAEGNLPAAPTFVPPRSGTLVGKPLTDPTMRLEWIPDKCSLLLSGSSRTQAAEVWPMDDSRSPDAHVDLEDQSLVYSESTGAYGLGAGWWCELRGWHWRKSKASAGQVRFWVGLLRDVSLDGAWLNLGVTTSHSQGLKGFHVSGKPSLTVLQIDELGDRSARPRLAVIIQATSFDRDVEMNLYAATNLLAIATGLPEAPIFYGYTESLEIVAYCSRGQPMAERHESWLPVRPLVVEKRQRERIWPVPFLHCLLRAVVVQSLPGLHYALIWFRFVLEEHYAVGQLIKAGIVVRLLLRRAPGLSLTDADWLNPDVVNAAMTRLAKQQRLNLPDGAVDALALSHRIALLGDFGIPPYTADPRNFYQSKLVFEALETLRITFATLLAPAIGYRGPVVNRLHPIRAFSSPHKTSLALDEAAMQELAAQEDEARATYVAGDPDAFPW